MDHDAIEISTEDRDGVTIVRLGGELDSMNAQELRNAFSDLLTNQNRLIVLDLSGLDFIDSAGLGSLVAVWEKTMERGCFLAVGEVSPRVHDVLRITGLSEVLQPHGSLDAAMRAVQDMLKAFPKHA